MHGTDERHSWDMSDTVRRQAGIAVAIALVLMGGAALASVWRATTPGVPPRLPSRPLVINVPPVWAQPATVAGATPMPVTTGEGWRVINQYSAHRILIIEVETEHIGHALGIAEDVVDRVKDAYSEVLVYFHRPKRTRVLASARVQWTPRHGYRLLTYEDLSAPD
jgi:hypothetical protein